MNRDDLSPAVRERLKRLPPPFDSHYGVVPLPPPEGTISVASIATRLSEANAALGRVDALAQELTDPWLISRILPRQEAVSSSAIEGTHSTLDELLSIEETEDENAATAAKQVRNYAHALDGILPAAKQVGNTIFTSDLIQDLHRSVMRGDTEYQDVPGALRSHVVWIGNAGKNIAYSTYNPTPPDDIPLCLEQSMAYMRCEGMQPMTQDLITRMAIAHAHFEAVHPFRDGNGRVGRLLLPLMMIADGHTPLYLSPYIAAQKDAYYNALKMAQQKLEWHHLVGFLSDAVIETVNELFVTREALQSLASIWQTRRRFRNHSTALKAMHLLPNYPVITVKRLAQLCHVSMPAATKAIDQLVEMGILRENTGYVRNRIFSAVDVLRIINRPFGHLPIILD